MLNADYIMAESIEEAIAFAASSKNFVYLAGGTDLVIDLKEKRIRPELVIDISRIGKLNTFEVNQEGLFIGSTTKFDEIFRSPEVATYAHALMIAAGMVGSPQIRNVGTVGGNIANGSPAADTVPALLVHNASVELHEIDGVRQIMMMDLIQRINHQELGIAILGRIFIPKRLGLHRSTFVKLGRRSAMAIARMNMAIAIDYGADGKHIDSVRVAVGALGPHAYLINGLDNIVGEERSDRTDAEIIRYTESQVSNILGDRATSRYKNRAIRGLIEKALREV